MDAINIDEIEELYSKITLNTLDKSNLEEYQERLNKLAADYFSVKLTERNEFVQTSFFTGPFEYRIDEYLKELNSFKGDFYELSASINKLSKLETSTP